MWLQEGGHRKARRQAQHFSQAAIGIKVWQLWANAALRHRPTFYYVFLERCQCRVVFSRSNPLREKISTLPLTRSALCVRFLFVEIFLHAGVVDAQELGAAGSHVAVVMLFLGALAVKELVDRIVSRLVL